MQDMVPLPAGADLDWLGHAFTSTNTNTRRQRLRRGALQPDEGDDVEQALAVWWEGGMLWSVRGPGGGLTGASQD